MHQSIVRLLSGLSGNRNPSRRRGARRAAIPMAAEVLEDRVLLAGDAFEYEFEGTLSPDADITAQLVGNFDDTLGDDIASFDANTGQWIVSLNDGQGNFTNQVWADFDTAIGWQNQVVGDFNDDGTDDIAQFNTLNGTWHVSLAVDDPGDADAAPDSFITQQWDDFLSSEGWVDQIVGDFNDDGFDDIANFSSFNATWWVSLATDGPDGDDHPDQFVTSLWLDLPTDFGWQNPVVGDFNDDGTDDIAQFNTINGTWWVLSPANAPGGPNDLDSFQFSQWADFQTTDGWVAQLVGDFNGDFNDDIANFNEFNNTWYISTTNAGNAALSPAAQQSFTTRLWSQLPPGNYTNHLIGDFNFEGGGEVLMFDDVASFDADTGRWYLGLSNAAQFETDVWSDFPTNAGWTFQHVGDFNNDVIEDEIMNFNVFNNSLWQSFGTFGFRNDTDVPINDLDVVESTINVTGLTGTVIDLNLRLDIAYTPIADLDLVLVSPTGIEVPLFADLLRFNEFENLENVFLDDEAAVGIANTNAPLSEVRLRPVGNLANFDGLDPNGTWTLRIAEDLGSFDEGALDSWNLIIKTATT